MDAHKAAALALAILSWGFRLAAIALVAIVCILSFSGAATRLGIVNLVLDISRTIPSFISGYGVIATPFGGVFRLDFALTAIALFVLDYAAQRISWLVRR